MNILQNLVESLSTKINVYVSIDSFRFESGNTSLVLNTYLFLRDESKGRKIVSVGSENDTIDGLIKVSLFDGELVNFKYDCLVDFIRYGFSQVVSKFAIIRPTIYCYGSCNLKPILNGYEESLLTKAFEEAGAVFIFMK